MPLKRYPKLSTVLASVSVSMLLSIILIIWYLGLLQTNLVQQTEQELNTQAAFVAALYRDQYARAHGLDVNRPFRIEESEVNWKPFDRTLVFDKTNMLPEQPQPMATEQVPSAEESHAGRALVRVLQDAQSKTLASIRVVNADGVVISSTNLADQVSLANRPEVRQALQGQHSAVLRHRKLTHADPPAFSISRRADYRVHVAHPIFLDDRILGAAVLSRTPQSLWQLLSRYKVQALITLAAIIGVTWMIMAFISHAIGQPINALMAQAKRAQLGEKGAVTPLANPVTFEVNELSKSVADMAQTLESRADFLLETTSHLSHEFKSPVTSLNGALELLVEHASEMSEAEQKQFLDNMQRDVQRLNSLVNRVLEFARADLKNTAKHALAMEPVFQALLHRYQSATADIQWQNHIQQNWVVEWRLEAIESILINLIDNAINAGASKITLVTKQTQTSTMIEVWDNGKAISKENQTKIFQPFFTLYRNSGGTGLGLSIVQALLKQVGGSIKLQPNVDDHMKCFFIQWPRA